MGNLVVYTVDNSTRFLNKTDFGIEDNTLRICLNGLLGLVIVILNIMTFVSVVICKSIERVDKICLLANTLSDALLGFHTLLIRMMQLVSADFLAYICRIRLGYALFLNFLTVFSKIAMTSERVIRIVCPFKSAMKITWQKLLICYLMIGVLSALLSYSLFYGGFIYCRPTLTGHLDELIGPLITIGLILSVGVVVDLILYAYIMRVTQVQIRRIAATIVGGNTPYHRDIFIRKKELRAIVTVGIITVAFVIGYFPMGLYFLICGIFQIFPLSFTVLNILLTFYLMNSFANPLIFIWRLKDTRQEIMYRLLGRSDTTKVTSLS